MSGLHADCGLLAEQFHDINFIVTDWINHLVVRILQQAHHSPRLLVLGTRKAIKVIIATLILQRISINARHLRGSNIQVL